jgi:hypothetical protein
MTYDPDSGDTKEWGWFHWRYYFDPDLLCYVLELDYNVDPEGKKALPLVKGILDLALVENQTSIIGKFNWRSPLLQKIPLIRRIGFVKAHRFLFYFEMKKIEGSEAALWLLSQRRAEKQMATDIGDPRIEGKRIVEPETVEDAAKMSGYPARIIEEDENMIKFPKGSDSWGKVKVIAIFDPREEGKGIAWFDTGDDETFTAEDDDTCSQ